MNFKRILSLAAIALLPVAAGAATLIVPAAGTGPGANNSQWQTELTLHSNSSSAITAHLVFHDSNGAGETASVTVAPRATVALRDIVKNQFHRDAATGAIEIVVDDAAAKKLAITSRTFNVSESGEFGQDIPAINVADAATAGDTIAIAGPSSAADNRFNAGLYAVTAANVRWELVRADGSMAKSTTRDYAAGTQVQYNTAIATLFGDSAADSDTILAVITNGSAMAYGSAVNNGTGDPTFVPGIETRSDIRVQFLGVSSGFDQGLTVADADRDGVLDAPLTVYASSPWPTSFRLVVNGSQPKFELLTPNPDVTISQDGYVFWKPSANSATTGELKIRVTVGDASDVITIPVKFQ